MKSEAPGLPVICLGGPTGCGKTGLAVEMAQAIGCEIINADSRQLYRDFPIITAAPSKAEMGGIAHHLYGFLDSGAKSSAGEWKELALARAAEIRERGKIPLLVGGTGFYFQALLHGLAPIPKIPEAITQKLAARLAGEGANVLYGELQKIDGQYAARIHPNDSQRIGRALEVYEATGRTFSWWHQNALDPPACKGPLIVLDPALASLEPNLERRIDRMLANGALEEAEKAFARCPDAKAPAWNGIGCAELLAFITGKMTFPECRKAWLKNTRAYAKRQRTWFHGRREACFYKPGDLAGILEKLRQFPGLP